MTNIIYVMITSILYTNPIIAYFFFVLIIAGVGITYFYRKEVGFIVTIIVSALLGSAGIFYPFIYALAAVCAVLLLLSLIGGGSITRPIRNLEGWIYLKRISRQNK